VYLGPKLDSIVTKANTAPVQLSTSVSCSSKGGRAVVKRSVVVWYFSAVLVLLETTGAGAATKEILTEAAMQQCH
jgi:hypothetical protein